MNKIVLQFGFLVFSLSMVFFLRMEIPLTSVILKSLIIFFSVTFTAGIIVILFIKSVNKTAAVKERELSSSNEGRES